MRSHLKVKVVSLAAEMTYIRRQEQKWKDRAQAARARQKINSDPTKNEANASAVGYSENNFWSLRFHRQFLKSDARWSHLAYGFLKGRSYSQMEQICYGDIKGFGTVAPDWMRIEDIITKFSSDEPELRDIMQRFSEWKAAAQTWYDGNANRITAANLSREAIRTQQANDAEYQAKRRAYREMAKEAGLELAANGWVKIGRRWKKSSAT